MYNKSDGSIVPGDIEALSFDSFDRDPERDIVCVAPVRTIVRREEEILLIRRVRKVEEVDAGPACPVASTSSAIPSTAPVYEPEKKVETAY